jgi:hypothetical protein
MKMRDHSSSSQRLLQANMLATIMAHKKIAAVTAVGVLALLTIPVAVGWQRAVQPVPTQNASSATAANEPASKDAQRAPLTQPSQPSADGSSSQVDTSTVVNDGQGTTRVNVNGQPIAVPQNGTVSKTVPNSNGGVTHVNVSSNSSSSGSNTTQSITNVQSDSTSTSQSVSTYSSQ